MKKEFNVIHTSDTPECNTQVQFLGILIILGVVYFPKNIAYVHLLTLANKKHYNICKSFIT